MASRHSSTQREPWYRRVNRGVLAVGAAATAVVAVVTAWNLLDPREPPDAQDVADIRTLTDAGTQTLADFTAGSLPEVQLSPAGDAAGRAAVVVPVDATAPPEEDDAVEDGGTPAGTADPSDTSTGDGSEHGTSTPDPDATTPAPTGTSTATAGPDVLELLRHDPVLQEYDLSEEVFEVVVPDPTALQPVLITTADPEAPGSTPLSEPEVQELLVEAVESTRSVPTGDGLDLLGRVFLAEIVVEGKADEEMHLTWALTGPTVPEAWQLAPVGYRVVAGTDDDQGSARIWVPLLEDPAEYHVRVVLANEDYTAVHDEHSAVVHRP